MSQEWYEYPVTQEHGQQPSGGVFNWESGEDFGTPNDTPVYFPWNCTVIDASFQTYGGQVACEVDGKNLATYFIHLDNIYVKTGDQVQAGEIIGDTGGGIGDNVLHNGVVQPAQSQSWFVDSDGSLASTGYHTEFGEFIANNMQEFNADWNIHSNQIDPSGTIQQLMQGGIGSATPPQGKPCNIPSWCNSLGAIPIPGAQYFFPQCNCNGNSIQGTLSQNAGIVSSSFFFRLGVGALGVVLIAIGVGAFTHVDTIIEKVA